MKERQILFNPKMVQAVLEGRKTQARRVMKIQPSQKDMKLMTLTSTTGNNRNVGKAYWCKMSSDGLNIINDDFNYFTCPYGILGNRLWVRETWKFFEEKTGQDWIVYKDGSKKIWPNIANLDWPQTGFNGKWHPSIHMPRWASRITLEITNVRVERIQDITASNIESEGVLKQQTEFGDILDIWIKLWDSINGKRPGCSWIDNPWVWVIEFKKV
jgi:hypothetical protein